jgi:ABC-type lipoprotein export system ATPase subunit
MDNYIIQAKNISKTYISSDSRTEVLRDVNINVKKGKVSAIIGESGAGKTTLLFILGGLLKPSKGNILVNDLDLYNSSEKQRCQHINKHIGFVFQDYQLLENLNVIDNICLPAHLKHNYSWSLHKYKYINRAKELLEHFNLMNRLTYFPNELSGGELQRIAIIRALINNPDIILCDEPTGNLDSNNAKEFINIILSLKKKFKTTFVIVSHSTTIVDNADHIFKISDGVIK